MNLMMLVLVALGACELVVLEGQRLSNDDIIRISRRGEITQLLINGCRLDGVDLTPLRNLQQLNLLYFCDTALSNVVLRAIAGIASLRKLEIRKTNLNELNLALLSALQNLEEMRIEEGVITANVIRGILKLVNLRMLTIFRCATYATGLPLLGALKQHLAILEFHCSQVGENTKNELLRVLPHTAIRVFGQFQH